MQGYNALVVYNEAEDRVLMCKRVKNPYQGLYNFVGGKIEPGESGLDAAYRELQEETSVTREDIVLTHLMDFTYYFSDCYLEVYVGKLNKAVEVHGDVPNLHWMPLDCDFFDYHVFAGEGNIGHIFEQINIFRDRLLV